MAESSSPPRAAHGSPGGPSGSIDESIDSIGRMYAELKSRIGGMAPSPKPAAAETESDRPAVLSSPMKRASESASVSVYDALPPRSPLPHSAASGDAEPISFDVDSSLTTTRNASLSSFTRSYAPASPARPLDAPRETSLVRSRDDDDAEAAIRAAARDLEREQVQVVERTRRLAATLLGRLAAVREEEEARREERHLDVQRVRRRTMLGTWGGETGCVWDTDGAADRKKRTPSGSWRRSTRRVGAKSDFISTRTLPHVCRCMRHCHR